MATALEVALAERDAALAEVSRLRLRVAELEAAAAGGGGQRGLPPLTRVPSGGNLLRPASATLQRAPLVGVTTSGGNNSPDVVAASGADSSASAGAAGADTPVIVNPGEKECGNCGRAVPSASFATHTMHCGRNFARCPSCAVVLPAREVDAHVAGERGTPAALLAALAQGDLARLQRMWLHGASPYASVPGAAHAGDTPLHIAARAGRAGLLDVLLVRSAGDAAGGARGCDPVNDAGETPLHAACSSARAASSSGGGSGGSGGSGGGAGAEAQPPPEGAAAAASALLRAGADIDARTLLGDTPVQVAQRARNSELVLLLSTRGGALRQGGGGSRPSSASVPSRG